MTHFNDIELQRWRESGPGDDRARVVEHVAACAECARRYAEAIRNRPLRGELEAEVRDFVAAGLRGRPRRLWIIPIAAAVLIAAIAVPLAVRRESTSPMRFRGAGIEALAPEGTVDRNAQFVWASGLAAVRFRINVGQGDRIVLTSERDASPMPLPAQIRSGIEYWWTVTALDDQGRPLVSSPRLTFTIRK